MRIWMKSPHGSELELEFEQDATSPDGMDTRLRQAADAYERLLAADFSGGAAASVPEELPEIVTELGPESSDPES